MKSLSIKLLLLTILVLVHVTAFSQPVPVKLQAAFKAFQNDPQLRNAIASLYVVDAKTGAVIFGENERIGLAPASTMKLLTSASAYELLGQDFRYKTSFAYQKNNGKTSLLISPSGDPAFGSWRWKDTKEELVLQDAVLAIRNLRIKFFDAVIIDNSGWNEETVPDGWMWQDIGNYYGAGPSKFNWRENQYDVLLKSGKQIGDPVTIVKTVPALHGYTLRSELTSAAAGTGDNAYIYFPLNGSSAVIRGTIPVNESSFSISGALPSASHQFVRTLAETLEGVGVQLPKQEEVQQKEKLSKAGYTTFHTITSPPLDSLIYWFNRKSINLYGEALLKTIAAKQTGNGATDKGLEAVQAFWRKRGIPESELNVVDGSGLSPLNRVTTHAQVQVLQHAQKQPWFSGFYTSLPVYNGMKMKSGTIRGVKGFTGYHTAKDGTQYAFSFLVNNYNGSSASLVKKMYQVLDTLK
ncbi:D-alanyl-D-alanine carboxypeptidase/D-alanyl-D-alanine endopeptidase [Pontibacter akesuensis]|uniref:D-alanyl-D-alanine carboxypeptidase / D-alanyl-D-alanine-endopeptidase (Penicillin-binding protein 4) n=1 Tax=Pontibacter akesuensis TaxID=388950 RepID=A0A1I7KT17_9BACT|nr:D-alanyl-D-alanine carboxypeptidase/D-alanyl-D-alanine-endopeptidase [Pontibacter akesuensis]GHA80789.1 peptidase M15 [Pontibacter akesuensis]SFV00599.1 D-alanyl-D-alanine carboxypeptidase / D-alanyl-D-alanine-endopeptidase (penicillin-binding protein 4) [Pontibacter akesuensis]